MKNLLCIFLTVMLLSVCSSNKNNTRDFEDWDSAVTAEEAQISAGNSIRPFVLQNHIFIGRFENDNDFAEFTIMVPEDGFYDLFISAYTPYGRKYVKVSINNHGLGEFELEQSRTPFEIAVIVFLNKGENIVRIDPGWTWFYIEHVRINRSQEDLFETAMQFDRVPVNPNINPDALRLWNFLTENYGKKIISGQQADSIDSPEIRYIRRVTGKTPAILGLDFMDYSLSRTRRGTSGTSVETAIQWSHAGGIVTFCWHWNAPTPYLKDREIINPSNPGQSNFSREEIWWSGFYTHAVNDPLFLSKIMTGEDPQGYRLLIEDMDNVAELLKHLQNEGVAVLWRPLHESSGGWFWWGSSGPDAQIWLWKLMYDRFTNLHGLNNLIWVWNGQHEDWFPGAEYVDITGYDIYPSAHDYGSQQGVFFRIVRELSNAGTMKIITLSENGAIPDIDNMLNDRALWSWWCVWGGDFVQQTSNRQLRKMYNDSRVITLENMPGLRVR